MDKEENSFFNNFVQGVAKAITGEELTNLAAGTATPPIVTPTLSIALEESSNAQDSEVNSTGTNNSQASEKFYDYEFSKGSIEGGRHEEVPEGRSCQTF